MRVIAFLPVISIGFCAFLSCAEPDTAPVFSKTEYFNRCGFSLNQMKVSDPELDSLLYIARKGAGVFIETDTIDVFLNGKNEETGLRLFEQLVFDAHISLGIAKETPTNKRLIDHLFANSLSSSKTPQEIIELALNYATIAPFEDRIKIGEASFFYSQSLSDSLATESVYRVVEGLCKTRSLYDNLDALALSKETAKSVIDWCKKGLPYECLTYKNSSALLYALSFAGFYAGDRHAGDFADSLFRWINNNSPLKSTGRFRFAGPIQMRFNDLLKSGEYVKADAILDYYLSDYQFSPYQTGWDTLYSHELKEYVSERLDPTDSVDLSGVKLTNSTVRSLLNIFVELNERHGEEIDNTMICCLSRARSAYLRGDTSFSDWLTNVFFRGIDNTFPSMTSWEYVDELLFPFHQYNHSVLDLMKYQYNNTDSRMVYDAILYLKGASNQIPIDIYKRVKETCPAIVVEYADSIRRFEIERWNHLSEHEYLEKEIGMSLKEILSGTLVSWNEVLDCLDSDEVAIEFYCCPSLATDSDRLYKAAIIEKGRNAPIIVELCDEKQLRDCIKAGRLFDRRFYDLVWRPIIEYVGGKNVIYYSTDGFLDVCNLQTVKMPEGSLMMDNYKMHLLSSTREIIGFKRPMNPSTIALFGGLDYNSAFDMVDETPSHLNSLASNLDRSICRGSFEYLPYTKEEVLAISQIAEENGVQAQLFWEGQGTEEAFVALTGGPCHVLHIATHGFYYSSSESTSIPFLNSISTADPLSRCGLILSRGQHAWLGETIPQDVEDGVLLGSEICALDFQDVDLVVLSACSTALGDFSPEGISGLRQAFKRAGVSSIIMTLGRVDDRATAYFMSQFYNAYFSSCNKHEAFSHAIEAMRMSNDFDSPRIWGNYVLID